MSIMKDLENLKIQLQDIRSATNNFGDKPIGKGGFGTVYKGELSFPEGSCMVAFKRLDRKFGQGETQFWKEILTLSQYRHENLIPLLRFCHEHHERILVYEYASRGSLDRYLSDTCLTWTQRLKICIGAAKGLNYLHDPMNTQKRLIHRDVKSSNILLDEKWTAKLSDFGLSRYAPANQKYTYVVSNVAGTHGYCDPLYRDTGVLSKESDVYSFGVVLFEVMCGRLCFESHNGKLRILVAMWKECYDEKRLNDIICHHLKEQVDEDSLKTFSSIAYQCLIDRKKRPTMAEIIKKLEMALDQQEMYQNFQDKFKFEEMKKILDQVAPIGRSPKQQLELICSDGVLLNDRKTWFSRNKDGNDCEMISASECMFTVYTHQLWPNQVKINGSRFDLPRPWFSLEYKFQLDVRSRFLSPHITYTINLVYKYRHSKISNHVPFKYKLDKETKYSTSFATQSRGDWLVTELYQFTSHKKSHRFKIQFMDHSYQDPDYSFIVEAIEFRPMECEKDENNENRRHSLIDFNIELEQKLTSEYANIIKLSKDSKVWKTKMELYNILRNGLLINSNGAKWFSISKNMKKRYMHPWQAIESAWTFLTGKKWTYKHLPESENLRFDTVAECCNTSNFTFVCKVESHLLSHETTYAYYLVYKLPRQNKAFEDIVQLLKISQYPDPRLPERLIYLRTPSHIPIISLKDQPDIPLHRRRRIKGHPKQRKDGWMEIQLGETKISKTTRGTVSFDYCLSTRSAWNTFKGLLVQGIEFRPAKVFVS